MKFEVAINTRSDLRYHSYAAEIKGSDPKYGLKRKFILRSTIMDYSEIRYSTPICRSGVYEFRVRGYSKADPSKLVEDYHYWIFKFGKQTCVYELPLKKGDVLHGLFNLRVQMDRKYPMRNIKPVGRSA